MRLCDSPTDLRSLLALAGALALAGTALGGCAQTISEEEEADDYPQAAFGHDDILELWTLEDGYYVSPVLEAPLGATRVGVLLTTFDPELPDAMSDVPLAMPELDVRTAGDGASGAWAVVQHDWSEEGVHVGVAELGAPATGVQLRVAADMVDAIESLQWSAVLPLEGYEEPSDELEGEVIDEVPADAEVGLASEDLRSDLARLGVVSRARWGARAGRGCSSNASKYRFAIHHTVSPQRGDLAAMVRGFQRYHQVSNGWCDIGYHFLIGGDGTIFEGRPLEQLGAHVGGHNTGNIGIAFIGCFDSSCPSSMGSRTPSDAAIRSAGRLIHRLSQIYRITITSRNVLGHRQHSGQYTTCPGQNLLDRLGRIRTLARSGGGGGGGSTPRPRRSCRSDTLGRNVTHGTCVQSSFSGCGRSRCSWFRCTDGAWTCTDLAACDGAEHRNASCPAGSGQCFDDFSDRSVSVGQQGYNQCGTNQYRRCTCSSGGRWTSCSACMRL